MGEEEKNRDFVRKYADIDDRRYWSDEDILIANVTDERKEYEKKKATYLYILIACIIFLVILAIIIAISQSSSTQNPETPQEAEIETKLGTINTEETLSKEKGFTGYIDVEKTNIDRTPVAKEALEVARHKGSCFTVGNQEGATDVFIKDGKINYQFHDDNGVLQHSSAPLATKLIYDGQTVSEGAKEILNGFQTVTSADNKSAINLTNAVAKTKYNFKTNELETNIYSGDKLIGTYNYNNEQVPTYIHNNVRKGIENYLRNDLKFSTEQINDQMKNIGTRYHINGTNPA